MAGLDSKIISDGYCTLQVEATAAVIYFFIVDRFCPNSIGLINSPQFTIALFGKHGHIMCCRAVSMPGCIAGYQ